MEEDEIKNEADESRHMIVKENESIFFNKYFALLLMGLSLFGRK
jgi:hypothetical protein